MDCGETATGTVACHQEEALGGEAQLLQYVAVMRGLGGGVSACQDSSSGLSAPSHRHFKYLSRNLGGAIILFPYTFENEELLLASSLSSGHTTLCLNQAKCCADMSLGS